MEPQIVDFVQEYVSTIDDPSSITVASVIRRVQSEFSIQDVSSFRELIKKSIVDTLQRVNNTKEESSSTESEASEEPEDVQECAQPSSSRRALLEDRSRANRSVRRADEDETSGLSADVLDMYLFESVPLLLSYAREHGLLYENQRGRRKSVCIRFDACLRQLFPGHDSVEETSLGLLIMERGTCKLVSMPGKNDASRSRNPKSSELNQRPEAASPVRPTCDGSFESAAGFSESSFGGNPQSQRQKQSQKNSWNDTVGNERGANHSISSSFPVAVDCSQKLGVDSAIVASNTGKSYEKMYLSASLAKVLGIEHGSLPRVLQLTRGYTSDHGEISAAGGAMMFDDGLRKVFKCGTCGSDDQLKKLLSRQLFRPSALGLPPLGEEFVEE
eukprot:ANDGO_02277.mRNA.1 hypothetical protein